MKKIITCMLILGMCISMSACALNAEKAEDEQITGNVQLVNDSIYDTTAQEVLDKTGLDFAYIKDKAENVKYNVITPTRDPMAEVKFTADGSEVCLRAKSAAQTALQDMEDFSGMYYTVEKTTETKVGRCDARVLSMKEYTIVQWLDAVPGIGYSFCITGDMDPEDAAALAGSFFVPTQDDAGPKELTDTEKTELDDLVRAIENATPGTAGSSLKRTAAAGKLIDFAQNHEDMDADALCSAIVEGLESYTKDNADFRSFFAEAFPDVKVQALEMAVNLDSFEGQLQDCGYTMKNTSFDNERIEFLCSVIELALTK